MFIDEVKIFARGGRGGDGCISFRREKYVPRGGPNGGDGGDGGSVYLQATSNINNLNYFRYHPHLIAENGEHGKGKSQKGRSGRDKVVYVPLGTVVKEADTGVVLADLREEGQRFLAARGGRGGCGNEHFKSPANSTPRVREFGEPGEEKTYVLELRMIADVGLVGFPNAGKSTLISRVTNAKPKIADYPFTTLEPMVGVVSISDEQSFVMADIPGIIEGAHEGRGLGIKFLKHIFRAKVLVFLIDITSENIKGQYETLKRELLEFSEKFKERPEIIVLSKADLIPQQELKKRETALGRIFPDKKCLIISSVSGYNLEKFKLMVMQEVERAGTFGDNVFAEEVEYVYRKEEEEIVLERQGNKIFVLGRDIERVASRVDVSTQDGIRLLWRRLKRFNLNKKLKKFGAVNGDIVVIGKNEFIYQENTT